MNLGFFLRPVFFWATHVISPFVASLKLGDDSKEFEEEEEVVHCCCTDPDNPVVFRFSRIVDCSNLGFLLAFHRVL